MAEDIYRYSKEAPYKAGTPERPVKPKNHWHTDSVEAVGNTNDEGFELFFMVESVVGSWEKADGLEDYEAIYVPRPAHYPPIQRVSLKYLDRSGSYKDAIAREEE